MYTKEIMKVSLMHVSANGSIGTMIKMDLRPLMICCQK